MKKIMAICTATATVMMISAATAPAWAQKAGQSVTIQYGTVTSAREVDLKSNAVPASAVVGGALGLAASGGKSSGTKARNSIIGMAAGGAIAGAAQGSQKGMLYDVNMGAGGIVQVVSDQREIRNGDCVSVERAGDTAIVRRVSSAYCDKANEQAVKAVANSARVEADECATAKQQLVDAKTTQEADLASRKIPLLCND
jgi:outer membrane lipoprotein SlyB